MNSFTFLYRRFLRQTFANSLGIVGLGIGIAISLLIFLWISNELSYDRFNNDYKRTYRLTFTALFNGEEVTGSGLSLPFYKQCLTSFPDIEEGIILHPDFGENIAIKHNGELLFENKVAVVDTNFFQFFDYKIKLGNPVKPFDAPDKVVISEQLAQRLFQDANPINQTIKAFGQNWQIAAVMPNMPDNSHIKANILFPIWGIEWMQDKDRDFNLYFKLAEDANVNQLQSRLADLKTGFRFEEVISAYHLQPLDQIRFSNHILYDFTSSKMDKNNLLIGGLLSLIILLLACVNFINLFIATLLEKTKAVVIRKVNGAGRLSIVFEFMLETFVYVLLAIAIGISMALLLESHFNQLANTSVSVNLYSIKLQTFLLSLAVFVTLISGLYPAMIVANTKVNLAKSTSHNVPGRSSLQQVLLIAQFTCSIVILIILGVIQKQIDYSKNIPLGYNTSNILYFNPYGAFCSSYDVVRNQLLQHPSIIDVTASSYTPIGGGDIVEVNGNSRKSDAILTESYAIKDNYFDFMGINTIRGANLAMFNDTAVSVFINKALQQKLAFTSPVGRLLKANSSSYEIKGVVSNIKKSAFHQTEPQLYYKMNRVNNWNRMLVKTNGSNKEALLFLNSLWQKMVPERPFEYQFLNEAYDEQYQSEQQIEAITKYGVFITLFISVLGLYAMVRFSMLRRTKEIGIRKANGASLANLLVLLNKTFMSWVVIAFVIACPIAWYVMDRWLETFAFKTNLSWWIFALAGILTLSIALLTVSWQSWRAAKRNPIEALRYE